jgi:hypothetical protein
MTLEQLRDERAKARKRLHRAERKLENLRERYPGEDNHHAEKVETKRKIEREEALVDELTAKIERKLQKPPAFRVIPRSEWGANPPRARDGLSSTANGIFIHHTVGATPTTEAAEKAEMRATQAFHMGPSRGWNDIAYSFLIAPSGRIYEGRGKGVAGAHTEGYNSSSYAICFMGRYDTAKPTDAAVAAARWLRRDYLKLGGAPLRPHSAVNQTDCPGQHLRARLSDI